MFTLRLIFYGLIAIVPSNSPENDGFLALMIDTRGTMSSMSHAMPAHAAIGLVTEGRFMGKRCTAEVPCELKIPEFTHFDFDRSDVGLAAATNTLRLNSGKQERILPRNAFEATDFTWAARMSGAAPDAGAVNPTCLFAPEHCRVWAALRLWTGQATACHLVHYVKDGETDRLRSFWFQPLVGEETSPQAIQALADAVEFQIPIRQRELSFSSVSFSGEGTPQKFLFLADPDTRTLTLVIANVPRKDLEAALVEREQANRSVQQAAARGPADAHHFEAYYEIAETFLGADSRRVPKEFPLSEAHLPEMRCEQEILSLASHLTDRNNELLDKGKERWTEEDRREGAKTPPHSKEVCVTAVYDDATLKDMAASTPLQPIDSVSHNAQTAAGAARALAGASRKARFENGQRIAGPPDQQR